MSNKNGQLTETDFAGEALITNEYNAIGKVVVAEGEEGRTTYRYNADNLIISICYSSGDVVKYSCDTAGNHTLLVYPDGSAVSYAHDSMNCMKSVTGHRFYVPEKGWTDAINLRAGDILVLSNGEYVTIEKVEHELLEEPVTIYNFEVEDFHTYYVGEQSVLVHNAKCSGGAIDGSGSTSVKVIGRLEDTAIAADWPGHDVLNIPDWTPEINRAWGKKELTIGKLFMLHLQ